MPQRPPLLAGTARVSVLLAVGLLIQLASCFVVYDNVPREVVAEVQFQIITEDGGADATNPDHLFLGILGFGLGSVLSLTAVIALGVLIALRLRDRDEVTRSSADTSP